MGCRQTRLTASCFKLRGASSSHLKPPHPSAPSHDVTPRTPPGTPPSDRSCVPRAPSILVTLNWSLQWQNGHGVLLGMAEHPKIHFLRYTMPTKLGFLPVRHRRGDLVLTTSGPPTACVLTLVESPFLLKLHRQILLLPGTNHSLSSNARDSIGNQHSPACPVQIPPCQDPSP